MKATKCKLEITIESLSKDTFKGQLYTLIGMLEQEYKSGILTCDDGDSTNWIVTEKYVEF